LEYPRIASGDPKRLADLGAAAKTLVAEFAHLDPEIPPYVKTVAAAQSDPERLAGFLAYRFPLPRAAKLRLLESASTSSEELLKGLLAGMMERFSEKAPPPPGALKADIFELDGLKQRMKALGMPEEARRATLEVFEQIEPDSRSEETRKLRDYLRWLTALPWGLRTRDRPIADARSILDRDHYGMERVKKLVLEEMAVRAAAAAKEGKVLALVGPPGVGKTSIAKSIARALGRRVVQLSMGAVRDEPTLRGHNRTYVGSLPGQILRGIRRAGAKNPVFILDEVDKIPQAGNGGDITALLLELLDREQNNQFRDTYLEVPFDLSEVAWVVTANVLGNIPEALRDRLEVVELDPYTPTEKLQIALGHLIPKALAAAGFAARQIEFAPAALGELIAHYTREAGVRELERRIRAALRRIRYGVAVEKKEPPKRIEISDLEALLDEPPYRESESAENGVGVATGLSVSGYGGSALGIEVETVPGTGKLVVLNQMGKMMEDSYQNAYAFVQANAERLGIHGVDFSAIDLHLSFPGADSGVDGPSAGAAIVTAMVSYFTHRPVLPDIAMTGTISLKGAIGAVGGIVPKAFGAQRRGIALLLYPAANDAEAKRIPEELRRDMELRPVSDYMRDVFPHVLGPPVADKGAPLSAPIWATAGPIDVTLSPSPDAGDPEVVLQLHGGEILDRFPLSEAAEILRVAEKGFRQGAPAREREGLEDDVRAYAGLRADRLRAR
ncbi:MAG: AAA family ATPase, partial [Elusimicrobia bacterium]|nr:AAA family ATPase [Elusimicrobiota bacterium]